MEQGLIPVSQAAAASCAFPARRGFALVTVLVMAAVGVLFGVGALLMFRYQCQMRIDRQHELEKVYAVRSALNYIKNNSGEIGNGRYFSYHTVSDRDLGVIVKPVKRIFPRFDDPLHLDLDMGNEGGHGRYFQASSDAPTKYDYEFGAYGTDDDGEKKRMLKGLGYEHPKDRKFKGLAFADLTATNNATCWVSIGMRDTGGWLQEDYGRRYYFQPRHYIPESDSKHTKDTIRLCIIRDVKDGWPLSREGERALVFQIRPEIGSGEDVNAVMTFSEYVYSNGTTSENVLIVWNEDIPAITTYMGMQIAGDKVSVFYTYKGGTEDDLLLSGYVFSDVAQLDPKTCRYFAEGCVKDADGKITRAPDLRAVFEFVASSNARPLSDGTSETSSSANFLTWFRVTPAYQYDVFLEHPATVTNLATVAQRIFVSELGRGEYEYAVRTYDTHGTEHKGFRKDERDWARDPARRKNR